MLDVIKKLKQKMRTEKENLIEFDDIVSKEQLNILVKIHASDNDEKKILKQEEDKMIEVLLEEDIYVIGFLTYL